jgi:small redox-active disulfide protein 2
MSRDDVIQIKVDGNAVGIMGLQEVMEEMAKAFAEAPDNEVRVELVKRLSKKNYIPDRVKENYAKAFLREFKKFLGRPYEEGDPLGTEIKVLGPGCAQCDRLEKELMEVLAEMGLAADVEHVTDIKEIGKYGVMGMPALLINGKVKSVGSIPTKNKLVEWLKEANG